MSTCTDEFTTGRDADPLTCDLQPGHAGPHVEADFSSREKLEWRTGNLDGLFRDLEQSETDRNTIRDWLTRGTFPETGVRWWGGTHWAVSRVLGMEPEALPPVPDAWVDSEHVPGDPVTPFDHPAGLWERLTHPALRVAWLDGYYSGADMRPHGRIST